MDALSFKLFKSYSSQFDEDIDTLSNIFVSITLFFICSIMVAFIDLPLMSQFNIESEPDDSFVLFVLAPDVQARCCC